MKKPIAVLAALAFLLVLLIKPFSFMEVYSTHAGHTIQSLTADRVDGPVMKAETGTTQRQKKSKFLWS